MHLYIALVKLSNYCAERCHWIFGFHTTQLTTKLTRYRRQRRNVYIENSSKYNNYSYFVDVSDSIRDLQQNAYDRFLASQVLVVPRTGRTSTSFFF